MSRQHENRSPRLVDRRGRLFGRLNVIDALAIVVVLALVPIAARAVSMVRPPKPIVASVTWQDSPPLWVVRGEHLRHSLRARVGPWESEGLMVFDNNRGEIQPPPLKPGTYDLFLYDDLQEVARVANAITIGPDGAGGSSLLPNRSPNTPNSGALWTAQAVGRIVGLPTQHGPMIQLGTHFTLGEVLSARAAEPATELLTARGSRQLVLVAGRVDVPVVVRLFCAPLQPLCEDIGPRPAPTTIRLADPLTPGYAPQLREVDFVITELQPDTTPTAQPPTTYGLATIRLRIEGQADAVAALKPGDVDAAVDPNSAATLADIEAGPGASEAVATIRARVSLGRLGWVYTGTVKVGAALAFQTISAIVTGRIVDVQVRPVDPDPRR